MESDPSISIKNYRKTRRQDGGNPSAATRCSEGTFDNSPASLGLKKNSPAFNCSLEYPRVAIRFDTRAINRPAKGGKKKERMKAETRKVLAPCWRHPARRLPSHEPPPKHDCIRPSQVVDFGEICGLLSDLVGQKKESLFASFSRPTICWNAAIHGHQRGFNSFPILSRIRSAHVQLNLN